MIRNQKGFALAMITALLPILIAAFFAAWAVVGFVRQDLALKHACREQGMFGQKKVSPLLKKLLNLNPEAEKLRKALADVDRKIAASQGNPFLLSGLVAQRISIEAKRSALGIKQKGLIQESNRELKTSHNRGKSQIQRNLKDTSSAFIQLKLKSLKGQASRLAVRPDYPDIAPTYSPVSDFAQQQALVHEWHYSAAVGKPFSYFLPGTFEFQKACAVTLKKEFTEWSPQIIKGNYSWKSVW